MKTMIAVQNEIIAEMPEALTTYGNLLDPIISEFPAVVVDCAEVETLPGSSQSPIIAYYYDLYIIVKIEDSIAAARTAALEYLDTISGRVHIEGRVQIYETVVSEYEVTVVKFLIVEDA